VSAEPRVIVKPVASEAVTGRLGAEEEGLLEDIANPIERLKLLSEDDEGLAQYLDAIEVTTPREREMMREISRTRPLAQPDRFPQAHRNMAEALESLARHGYHGTTAGRGTGPLRVVIRWAVKLVARYLVVSYVKTTSTRLRNLYGLREIQALPGSEDRRELRRARMDADRMVAALETKELALPAFLIGGAAIPIVASIGRLTGILERTWVAALIGIVGALIALAASWIILRGAALASRRIRLATGGPLQALWNTIGWCGNPPKDSTRTFVLISVGLTLGCWILVPILVGIGLAS
jgi:plasmid stabilization system protein ParE